MKIRSWLALTITLFGASSQAQGKQQTLLLRQYPAPVWLYANDTTPVPTQHRIAFKSENQAFNASLWGTVAPTATVVLAPVGLIFGPATGYFYGGMPGRAWTGIGLRTLGVGGMLLVIGLTYANDPESGTEEQLAWIGFIGGGALMVVSAVYDIATVKKAVRNRNAKLRQTGWILTPKYFAGRQAGGLELQLRF